MARHYDAALGRFTSADTIVPNAGVPGDFDRYAYVRNAPTTMIDPSGHRPICEDGSNKCEDFREWAILRRYTNSFSGVTFSVYVHALLSDFDNRGGMDCFLRCFDGVAQQGSGYDAKTGFYYSYAGGGTWVILGFAENKPNPSAPDLTDRTVVWNKETNSWAVIINEKYVDINPNNYKIKMHGGKFITRTKPSDKLVAGKTVAASTQFPMGTIIYIPDLEMTFIVTDRGGAFDNIGAVRFDIFNGYGIEDFMALYRQVSSKEFTVYVSYPPRPK